MTNAAAFRVGRGRPPVPIKPDDKVIILRSCPDCSGRGWFLINPFATGGSDGSGGISNKTQCLTCLACEAYWRIHGKLPDGIPMPDDMPESEGILS